MLNQLGYEVRQPFHLEQLIVEPAKQGHGESSLFRWLRLLAVLGTNDAAKQVLDSL